MRSEPVFGPLASAIVATILLAHPAAAQGTSAQPVSPSIQSKELRTEGLAKLALKAATPGDSSQARSGVEAILNASSDDSKVTIHVGAQVADSWVLDATVSSPLDESASRTDAVTASKAPLASGAKVTFGSSYTFFQPTEDPDAIRLACAGYESLGSCSTTNAKLPTLVRQAIRRAVVPGTAVSVGGRLTIGRQTFEFRDSIAGAKAEETHTTPVAFTTTIGALVHPKVFLGAQVGGEHTYSGVDKTDRCEAVAVAPGVSTCEDIALAKPDEKNGALVILEARFFFSNFAVAPRYERRSTKDLNLLELPFYFLSDPDAGGWTGGIVARIANGDKSFAVFVGPTLSHFGFK